MSLYINLSSTRISWLLLYKIQMFIQRKRWYPIILDIDCGPYTFTCGRDAKHFYSDLVYVLSVIFIMILDHECVWTGQWTRVLVYCVMDIEAFGSRFCILRSDRWKHRETHHENACLSFLRSRHEPDMACLKEVYRGCLNCLSQRIVVSLER